jgi:hypothetical protein
MSKDRGGDHDRVNGGVLEQIVAALRRLGCGIAAGEPVEPLLAQIADPRDLDVGPIGKNAQQVGAPVPEADEGDASSRLLTPAGDPAIAKDVYAFPMRTTP